MHISSHRAAAIVLLAAAFPMTQAVSLAFSAELKAVAALAGVSCTTHVRRRILIPISAASLRSFGDIT